MDHERRIGSIIGPIRFRDSQGTHNLFSAAWKGPSGDQDEVIEVIEHSARFVLLVEKRTIFERLSDDGFAAKNACLLTCGDGYPGLSFRRVLRHFHDQIGLRFYILADNDPGGYEFFFFMARGSARSSGRVHASERKLAIPGAAYIGLKTNDYERMGMGKWAYIDLSESDRLQLDRLVSCVWLKSETAWQNEFDTMAGRGFKFELEATSSLSKGYLSDTYLPECIAAGDYLKLAAESVG